MYLYINTTYNQNAFAQPNLGPQESIDIVQPRIIELSATYPL